MERSVQEAIVTWVCRGWPVVIIVVLFHNWNKKMSHIRDPDEETASTSRVKCKQSNSSEQSSIRLCRAAGLVRHSKVEVSAAAEPPTWPTEHILCCRPEDLFWEGFMFVCLLEMKCTMTQICLWSLVTSDVWIRDWCLSASGCPAQKERLCCCPWKKKIHTGNMGNIWTFVLWSCFPCILVFIFIFSARFCLGSPLSCQCCGFSLNIYS